MPLTTLTENEKRWRRVASEAVERDQEWEKCGECGWFHPEGYDGACDEKVNRLPSTPERIARAARAD